MAVIGMANLAVKVADLDAACAFYVAAGAEVRATGGAASATRVGHWLRWLHTGDGPLLWSMEEAVGVLRLALAAYASNAAGGIGIDPATLTPH